MKRLVLVRHGETEWSRDRRHTGLTDVPLTPTGESQARDLGGRVADLDLDVVAAVTSPARRAADTARLSGFGDARRSDLLWELDYGDYEGLSTAQIREGRPDWDLFRDGCPGGETVEDVAARSRTVLDQLDPEGGDGDVVLFGHGHQLRVLAVTYLGLAPAGARHLALATAGLSILGHEHEWRAVHLWNG